MGRKHSGPAQWYHPGVNSNQKGPSISHFSLAYGGHQIIKEDGRLEAGGTAHSHEGWRKINTESPGDKWLCLGFMQQPGLFSEKNGTKAAGNCGVRERLWD